MSQVLRDRKYTESHEWVKIEGNMATIGVTDFAQHAMGDVVYVELPDVGRKAKAGEDFIVVESVKGANDVFCPVSGTVAGVNEDLDGAPELLNQDPYSNWLVKMEVDNPSDVDKLLDAAAYAKLVEELEAEES